MGFRTRRVMNMYDLPVNDSSTRRRTTDERSSLFAPRYRHVSICGHNPILAAFHAVNIGVRSFAEPRCTFGHHVQYWLNVRRGAGDHAKNFTRGSLLLQGFAKLRVRCFEFPGSMRELLEKADILDGDHRLVRERGDQFDLFIGKGENFLSLNQDHSEEGTLP